MYSPGRIAVNWKTPSSFGRVCERTRREVLPVQCSRFAEKSTKTMLGTALPAWSVIVADSCGSREVSVTTPGDGVRPA